MPYADLISLRSKPIKLQSNEVGSKPVFIPIIRLKVEFPTVKRGHKKRKDSLETQQDGTFYPFMSREKL